MLAMVNESIHKNPQGPIEERFLRMEEQVVNIYHNMSLLMVTLTSKIIQFEEVGGSKYEIISKGKL
jgi:hypothetical protein